MKNKLLTWATAGTILLFVNQSSAQEIVDVLYQDKKLPTTKVATKQISDTLTACMDYGLYESEKNRILSDSSNINCKNDLSELIDSYLIQNEDQILQDPKSLEMQLTMMYYDCEFVDVEVPEKLRYMLGLIDFQHI